MKKETVTIHGKEYETVASRVQRFREQHPDWTIYTKLVERTSDDVVMKASIKDEKGRTIATGHAEERREANTINRTSALEVCETSAIGRALAAFGLAGTEYASADEVAQAVVQQDRPATDKTKKFLNDLYQSKYPDGDILAWMVDQYGAEPTKLTQEQASRMIEDLK